MVKGSSKKLFLILDNKIVLFFLPSYSPELNPDEYLNNDLKIGIRLKATPKNENQMKKKVKSHMAHLQKNSEKVKRFFLHRSIKYAA